MKIKVSSGKDEKNIIRDLEGQVKAGPPKTALDTTTMSRAGFPLSWPGRWAPGSHWTSCRAPGCNTWGNIHRIGSYCYSCWCGEHLSSLLLPEWRSWPENTGPAMYFERPNGKWKCWHPKWSEKLKCLFKIIKNQDSNNNIHKCGALLVSGPVWLLWSQPMRPALTVGWEAMLACSPSPAKWIRPVLQLFPTYSRTEFKSVRTCKISRTLCKGVWDSAFSAAQTTGRKLSRRSWKRCRGSQSTVSTSVFKLQKHR